VRYDTILRSKINVRAWTQKNYVPTPRARHLKVYGTRSYDPSTVSGKDYFWTTEQVSRDLCPLCGVWHGLRFNIFFCFFFRCVVAAATMLCSPTNYRLQQFRATGVQPVSSTVATRTRLRNHMKRRDNLSLQPVAPVRIAAPATTFSVQASPLPRPHTWHRKLYTWHRKRHVWRRKLYDWHRRGSRSKFLR
jgi:hypothetical protein